MESRSRLENISELMNSVYDYEEAHPESTLDAVFTGHIASTPPRRTRRNDPEPQSNAVTLMTVHNAKGLEFPVVFLTGMEEDIFPHRLSSDTEEGIEEERRLCYVGITRPWSGSISPAAELRRTFNEIYHKEPSRFIFEIPEELLEKTSFVNGAGSGGTRDFGRGGFGGAPSRTVCSVPHFTMTRALRRKKRRLSVKAPRAASRCATGCSIPVSAAAG